MIQKELASVLNLSMDLTVNSSNVIQNTAKMEAHVFHKEDVCAHHSSWVNFVNTSFVEVLSVTLHFALMKSVTARRDSEVGCNVLLFI